LANTQNCDGYCNLLVRTGRSRSKSSAATVLQCWSAFTAHGVGEYEYTPSANIFKISGSYLSMAFYGFQTYCLGLTVVRASLNLKSHVYHLLALQFILPVIPNQLHGDLRKFLPGTAHLDPINKMEEKLGTGTRGINIILVTTLFQFSHSK
ncbi:hypothetical protein DM01DRAFT_332909, partial [Hesseltinella vesiculosa]